MSRASGWWHRDTLLPLPVFKVARKARAVDAEDYEEAKRCKEMLARPDKTRRTSPTSCVHLHIVHTYIHAYRCMPTYMYICTCRVSIEHASA